MRAVKNYNLFNKYLGKISADTIAKFGSRDNVILFLQAIATSGNIAFAARKVIVTSLIQLHQLVHDDKYLTKCVGIALEYAAITAEGVLYDRAVNGYEELTYDQNNKIIARKKKYCSKSLLEYLKANSVKYKPKKNIDNKETKLTTATTFEVESYGSQDKK